MPQTKEKRRASYNDAPIETRLLRNSHRRHLYTQHKRSRTFGHGYQRLATISTEPYTVPTMANCPHCNARRFYREPPGFCCSNGQVFLYPLESPVELYDLFTSTSNISAHFRTNARTYNNSFAFTSLGITYDKSLCRNDKNIYTFRVQGMVYHFINDLIPTTGCGTNLQLYFFDVVNEVQNRLCTSDKLEAGLVMRIIQILEGNPYAHFFRSLRDISNLSTYRIVLRTDPSLDQRVYNIPITEQVAAIWQELTPNNEAQQRHIRVYTKSGKSQVIKYYYACYDPLQYPLLHPYGQPGWYAGIKRKYETINFTTESTHTNNEPFINLPSISTSDELCQHEETVLKRSSRQKGTVSAREYYCYRLQVRDNNKSALLHSGRLLQQFACDMYIKVETQRLDYYRSEQIQKDARPETIQGIVDSLGIDGHSDASQIGQPFVLPPTFIGGPRDLHRRYMDAMTLVQTYGKPDFFLTMTCNPNWPEITANKLEHELSQNRPDLVARIFRAKVEELKEELVRRHLLGEVAAFSYVIEFQKRGLPHTHWLLVMKDHFKIRSADAYDRFISAELPDKSQFPYLYSLVVKHMLHGPCGSLNKNNVCMRNGICKNHFPKNFCDVTSHAANSYPLYRRRNDGHTATVRKHTLDNRWVVPYNPYLLAKFDCHINVEICSDIKLVKYLYKYIYKGHDKISYGLHYDTSTPNVDEIKNFQTGRWIAAPESCWRLFGFLMNDMHPSVMSLQLHLPNHQYITFNKKQNLANVLSKPAAAKTMLTEFFYMNKHNARAKELNLLYREFPQFFVWSPKFLTWSIRKQGTVIGRIVSASPVEGERYYERILLQNIRGPPSFDSLKSVHNTTYETFRDAVHALGLLDTDDSLQQCLQEAATYQLPYTLRRLFATILVYCSPTNPQHLWERFKSFMIEDFVADPNLSNFDIEIKALDQINKFLVILGRSLKDYQLCTSTSRTICTNICTHEYFNEKNIEVSENDLLSIQKLNSAQSHAFHTITNSIYLNISSAYFIDGPAGSGKTFLYRALLAHIRSKGDIALAVATSGVAASLLPGGRTAHSRFKIPIDVKDKTLCRISKQSTLSKLLLNAKLIIWDEISMARRELIEALDEMLQDLTEISIPFGGKVIVFGGDFRQVAPVVIGGEKEDIINASFVSSALFKNVQRLPLHYNLRAIGDPTFANFVQRIGDDVEPHIANDRIEIPRSIMLPFLNTETSLSDLIHIVFPSLNDFITNPTSMTNRCVLTPTNECVDYINEILVNEFPGPAFEYISYDKTKEKFQQSQYEDFLSTATPSGIPPHKLTLKVGCPIMLLRNINPIEGLCNGTRLICRGLHDKVIHAEISNGEFRGKLVFIPKIPLESTDIRKCPVPFVRTQFPVKLCFALTINKAQGQTLDFVGIYLREPVFCHGQLYVALSRARNAHSIKVLIQPPTIHDIPSSLTRNVVYHEILRRTTQQ